MNIIKSVAAFCLTIPLLSCSVKEDRGPCPCQLNVNIENCEAYTDRIMLSAWRDGCGNLFTDRIKLKDYSSIYTRKVSKGSLFVSAFSGYEEMLFRDGTMSIPEGEDCKEIMAFKGGMLDASGDSVNETVTLHKQYARIFLNADEVTQSIGNILYRVVGTVNGFDISTLAPCRGSFNAIAEKDSDGVFSLNVPRQVDDNLILEVYVDGVLSGTVGIGEEICNSGYSWEDEDLLDIYLTVSLFSDSMITAIVHGWDTMRVQYTI